MSKLFKALTARLLVATLAVVIITFTDSSLETQKAAIIGGFLLIGVMPNAILQLYLNRKYFPDFHFSKKLFNQDNKTLKGDFNQNKTDKIANAANKKQSFLAQMLPNQKAAIVNMEISYVFWFSLLAVIAGSQLLQNTNLMYLAMAYAIYHGINLFVIKFFYAVAIKSGEIVFWVTVLTNLNPIFALGYLVLVLFLWYEIEKPKFDIMAFNYSLAIGLFAALITWIS